MKNKIKLFLTLTVLLTGLTSCGGKSDDGKTTIRVGFWPQSNERSDVAMYEKWKEAFEKDYPEYKIVGENYTYSKDTIGPKATARTLPTVFQTWFTDQNVVR